MGTDRDRLEAAYEATAYRVWVAADRRIAIRVGDGSEAVDAILAAAGVDAWAFITAANPRSVRQSDAENAARMARLVARVRERGLGHLPGEGAGDDPDWPAEPSLFVPGLAEHDAAALAREFGQHAIVVGRRGEPARLLWVEPRDAT
ncbi:MAG: DUF3293 domain-containing protein [Planctomycetaceae bacterium]